MKVSTISLLAALPVVALVGCKANQNQTTNTPTQTERQGQTMERPTGTFETQKGTGTTDRTNPS